MECLAKTAIAMPLGAVKTFVSRYPYLVPAVVAHDRVLVRPVWVIPRSRSACGGQQMMVKVALVNDGSRGDRVLFGDSRRFSALMGGCPMSNDAPKCLRSGSQAT